RERRQHRRTADLRAGDGAVGEKREAGSEKRDVIPSEGAKRPSEGIRSPHAMCRSLLSRLRHSAGMTTVRPPSRVSLLSSLVPLLASRFTLGTSTAATVPPSARTGAAPATTG